MLPEQSRFLWNISWFSLVSALFASFMGKYDLAIVPGSVFITSLNYWRDPDYSWRRWLDMGVVITTCAYQGIRAYSAENARIYYCIMGLAASCFPIGCYFYSLKMLWPSTLCHAGVHIFGNMANIILYSGRV